MADFIKKWESAYDKKNYRDATNYAPSSYTQSDIDTLLSSKENAIPSGSTTQFWRGDKTWQTIDWFTKTEIATLLSGKENLIAAGTLTQYFRGDKTWQTLNTTVVVEGTNLYYTQARFDSAFAAKTTTDLTEGSNLYFTTERARVSVSASYPLTYNSSTGVFGFGYNTTNLKLTSNQLNTIQNITITSAPTFAGLTINGSITQTTNSIIKNSFSPGWTGQGWQLDYGISTASKSNLEVDNLTVRNTMRVYELLINQIRATNGSLLVGSSARVASAAPDQYYQYTVTFEDPEGHGVCPFAAGDTIMMQRVKLNSTSVIKKVALLVGEVNGMTVSGDLVYQSSPTDVPEKGDLFTRIGNDGTTANRQGTVYLTSDDSASPYIDIYDGVTGYANWATDSVRKVRLGKLTGLTDSNFGSLSGYGLYATNAYLKGSIWSTSGNIGGWNINDTAIWKLGSGTPTSSPASGISINSAGSITVYGNYWQKRVALYYTSSTNWGLIGTNDSYQTVFQLGYTNQIAGWAFDTTKFRSASNEVQIVTNYTSILSGAKAILGNYASGKWGIKSENYSFVDSTQALTLTSESSSYWSDLKSETWTGTFSSNSKFVSLINEAFASGTGGFATNYYTGQSSMANASGQLRVRAYTSSSNPLAADILVSKSVSTGASGIRPFTLSFDYSTFEYVISGKIISHGTFIVKIVENAYNGTVLHEFTLDNTSTLTSKSITVYSSAATLYVVAYVYNEPEILTTGYYGYADLFLDNIKLYYWNSFNEISKDGIIFFTSSTSYLQMGKDAFTFKGGAIVADSLTVNKINGYNACRFRGRLSTYPSSDVKGGDIYYNTSDGKIYMHNGNYWQALT